MFLVNFEQLKKEQELAATKARDPEENGEILSVRFASGRALMTVAEKKAELAERIGINTRRR